VRVTWVHPSWRDLVIERLADDPGARRGFLERCALPGALLALSTSGGAGGERALPLLLSDADWDALDATVHRLALELDQHDLAVLAGALADALAAAPGGTREELNALADETLATVRRRLDREHAVIEPGLLDAWRALADRRRGTAAQQPKLDATWAALDPGAADPHDLESVRHLAEFLEFAAGSGLPERVLDERYGPVLEQFCRVAAQLDECPPLVLETLRRIEDLIPDMHPLTQPLLPDEARPPWLDSPETADLPDGRDRIARILRDL
jgi:hypothetical protein